MSDGAGIRSEAKGYWLDPRPHLAVLPRIGMDLPVGARAAHRQIGQLG